jgi:AraC-like DNA-binding protein
MHSKEKEKAELWCVPHLGDLRLLRANFVTYGFKRHMHDYFVIGMIEDGLQKFSYGRELYVTPPTGLIVINPGEMHTGEAAVPDGFRYRALYPDAALMGQIASEIKGRSHAIPFFTQPVIEDKALFQEIRNLHVTLEGATTVLEHESRYLLALATLIMRHADVRLSSRRVGWEKQEVKRIRQYIDGHYAEDIKLADLADLVHWSPYYLLRAFRAGVGLPPHAYLENVRVREAQRLLQSGKPLAQVSYETGFSSQSHFTTTFKYLIGVTPGQYAKQVNFLKDRDSRADISSKNRDDLSRYPKHEYDL